ncbi:hypothetical protein [Clostridium sp.]|uniref:hypothetical protein n=1 Tax=Clostridium sp. TaxID=1506 RepID=UPI003D6D0F11
MVENFFRFEDNHYHEISTIYLVNLEKESWILNEKDSFNGIEGERLIYKWFNINDSNFAHVKYR